MTTTRDRKIPLLIGGIVVAGGLLLASVGATAVIAGHAKMGVFDDRPTRIELRRSDDRSTDRSERSDHGEQMRRLMEGLMNQRRVPGGQSVPGDPGVPGEQG